MTSVIESSKKPSSDVGKSQSFRLDYRELKRVDAIVCKHSQDRHVFYRNCVMVQVKLQEAEDKQAEQLKTKPNEGTE